jgi:hypothetical protein
MKNYQEVRVEFVESPSVIGAELFAFGTAFLYDFSPRFYVFFIACAMLPILGAGGYLSAQTHRLGDFQELLRMGGVANLPSVRLLVEPDRKPAPVARGSNDAPNRKMEANQDNKDFYEGRLAQHSDAEYFLAWFVMTIFYCGCAVVAVFGLPDALKLLASFNISPFSEATIIERLADGERNAGFTAVTWAFWGAYFYALQILTTRLNTRDVTPGVFYSLLVRLVLAVTLALLLNYSIPKLPAADTSVPFLPPILFFCGVFPQRILDWFWSLIASQLAIKSHTTDDLPLRLITGIGDEHEDRLREIGIDSAHTLAMADPIRAYVRMPYRLNQVIDWAAQAMLYCAFGRDGVGLLRAKTIRNIFDIEHLVENQDGRGFVELANILNVEKTVLEAKWAAISSAPYFIRLRDLARAVSDHERGAPVT